MQLYLVRRVLRSLLAMLAISLIAFALSHLP